MKTANFWRMLGGTLIIAAAGAVLGFRLMQKAGIDTTVLTTATAAEAPRVIEIKARRFQFTPNEITLKKGEPVILRLSSEDRTHGFLLKALKVDTDIVPGKATDIALKPQTAGQYIVICDHYCGTGHGNMKMKLTVVE
jgi:cytochrome c oxidase subunit 2